MSFPQVSFFFGTELAHGIVLAQKYEIVHLNNYSNDLSCVLLDSWHGLDYCSLALLCWPFFGRADPLGHVGQLCPSHLGGTGHLQVVKGGGLPAAAAAAGAGQPAL